MQLRTFLARDMREALANVRAEMGGEAVIVASQKTKDGGVMVRAAFDQPFEEAPEPAAIEAAREQSDDELPQTFEGLRHETLSRRVRGEAPKTAGQAKSFSRPELLKLLGAHRTPDSIAHDLAKTAEQSGLDDMTLALACALDRRMKLAP